jgi:hypothetical protein
VADLSHERARLHAAVDRFIQHYEDMDGDYPDLMIDTFAIISIGTWRLENDDEAEAPFMWFEARRNHVQLGLLRTCQLDREGEYFAESREERE